MAKHVGWFTGLNVPPYQRPWTSTSSVHPVQCQYDASMLVNCSTAVDWRQWNSDLQAEFEFLEDYASVHLSLSETAVKHVGWYKLTILRQDWYHSFIHSYIGLKTRLTLSQPYNSVVTTKYCTSQRPTYIHIHGPNRCFMFSKQSVTIFVQHSN